MSDAKKTARAVLEARRRSLTHEEVQKLGGEAQSHLAALSFFTEAKVIALYASQGFELSTSVLREKAPGRVVYPRVVQGSKQLVFARAQSFVRSAFGLDEPPLDAPTVSLREIDVWVIPGVGFTRGGARLGRGGGYYDTTLAAARPDAVRVGFTFDCCLVDDLPVEAHDERVDWIVTESGAVKTAPLG